MSHAVSIRTLVPDDLAVYRTLRLRGLAEHPDAFTSSAEEEAAKPDSALAERLAPARNGRHFTVLGAFDDGALAGMVGFDVDARIKVRHRGHVFGMYVPVERAGNGIGTQLLATLIARARRVPGVAQLVLTVTATNDAARRLYERAGFTAFGREPRAVIVGDQAFDKLHMIRFLAGSPLSNTDNTEPA